MVGLLWESEIRELNEAATPEIYTHSLQDALPVGGENSQGLQAEGGGGGGLPNACREGEGGGEHSSGSLMGGRGKPSPRPPAPFPILLFRFIS